MLEGRFFLGVGFGEQLNERPFGVRFPSAGERRDHLREAIEVMRDLWQDGAVSHRGARWTVEGLRLSTRPAFGPPIYVAASGPKSAALAGEVSDGLIAVEPNARVVDVFRGSGGEGKRCVAQLHVSLAATLDEARANAFKWWPTAVVPAPLLGELARPEHFDAVAAAIGPRLLDGTVVCASDPEPVVAAIDRFVGAGYGTIYLHQIGPDQQRLLDAIDKELGPHYAASSSRP
jgi:coenzyme F420-dependent glucose-6-phosphate dehydrogenase